MRKRGLLVSLSALAVCSIALVVLLSPAITSVVVATPAEVAPAASHDIYNPARTALVNAQRQLAESLWQEQEILERIQRAEQELDTSLALLASAEQLDPSMKAPIDGLRSRLAALQDSPSLCPMGSNSSLDLYRQLLDELQTLIEHY